MSTPHHKKEKIKAEVRRRRVKRAEGVEMIDPISMERVRRENAWYIEPNMHDGKIYRVYEKNTIDKMLGDSHKGRLPFDRTKSFGPQDVKKYKGQGTYVPVPPKKIPLFFELERVYKVISWKIGRNLDDGPRIRDPNNYNNDRPLTAGEWNAIIPQMKAGDVVLFQSDNCSKKTQVPIKAPTVRELFKAIHKAAVEHTRCYSKEILGWNMDPSHANWYLESVNKGPGRTWTLGLGS